MGAFRSRSVRAISLIVAVVALIVVFLQVRDAVGRTASTPLAARLDAVFERLVPDGQAGCAAAVHQGDGLVWTGARGYAVTAGRHPITDETLFGLGVTTQRFTGTAVLLLAHQGRLDLDAPISRYLPGLPAWSRSVTSWNLLLGTSGIPNAHDLLGQQTGGPITNGTVRAAIAKVPQLTFRPGTGGDDTDGDYVLLGDIVRAVTHRSLAAYLATEVFPAAGLHSAVLDRDPRGPDVAASYQQPTDAEPYRDEAWRTVGDIGLHMTAKDLATWGAQYWHPTVGGAEVARQRMRTVRGTDAGIIPGAKPVSSAFSWGTGIGVWTVDGGRLVAGSTSPDEATFSEDAFQSDLVVIPSQHLAAAALCNHLAPEPHVASELAMRLLGVMRGRPVRHPVPYP